MSMLWESGCTQKCYILLSNPISPPPHSYIPSSPLLHSLLPTPTFPPPHSYIPSSPLLHSLLPTPTFPPPHSYIPSSPLLHSLLPTPTFPPPHSYIPSSPLLHSLLPTPTFPPPHSYIPSSPLLHFPLHASIPSSHSIPSSPLLQEMDHLPADINLLALKVGDTVGLLRQGSGALHFFLNGVHMVKLPCTVPEGVYGLVDLYGQCVKVTLRPLTTWCDEVMSSGMRSSSQPSPFTAQATPFTAQATPFIPQATPFTAQAPPITPQATPFTTQATPTSLSAPVDKRPSLPGPTVLPESLGVPWVLPSWICSYQNTCNTLVCESLLLPGGCGHLHVVGVVIYMYKTFSFNIVFINISMDTTLLWMEL